MQWILREVFVNVLGSLGSEKRLVTPRKREGNTALRGMTWPDPEGQEAL